MLFPPPLFPTLLAPEFAYARTAFFRDNDKRSEA